jgi:hypothetical protein
MEHEHFWGFIHWGSPVTYISLVCLLIALASHRYGVKRTGEAIRAADHIHHAPVLSGIYSCAEKRYFDPYDIGLKVAGVGSRVLFALDRANNWFYDTFLTGTVRIVSTGVRRAHTGVFSEYLAWSLAGGLVIFVFLVWVM